MRKIIRLLAGFVVLSAGLMAQINSSVRVVESAPSGACKANERLRIVASNGHLYVCTGGTWTDVTPSVSSSSVATDVIFDAKGDMAIGIGADAADKLAVGGNGQFPIADSSQATGLRYGYLTVEDYRPAAVCNGDTQPAVFAPGWGYQKSSESVPSCGSGYTAAQPTQGALGFDEGSDLYATYAWLLPDNFQSLVSITYDYATSATSGNIAMHYSASCYTSGTTTWLAGTAPTYTAGATTALLPATTTYGIRQQTVVTTDVNSCAAGKHISTRFGRLSSSQGGTDTNAGTFYLLGVKFKYTVKVE